MGVDACVCSGIRAAFQGITIAIVFIFQIFVPWNIQVGKKEAKSKFIL
jgi:hypothetical protein